MASTRRRPETAARQAAASERATARGAKREAAWGAAREKLLARVSRFQKQRQFIEISTSGTTLVVTRGTVGATSSTRRSRFGDEKTLERAVKRERAAALLARFRKVRSIK